MDSYQYQSGGYSLQSTTMVRTQPQTVVIVSTATPVGGDKSNGDFSDSALAFAFNGTAPSVYVVVPSKATFTDPAVPANAILVENTVGISHTTGNVVQTLRLRNPNSDDAPGSCAWTCPKSLLN